MVTRPSALVLSPLVVHHIRDDFEVLLGLFDALIVDDDRFSEVMEGMIQRRAFLIVSRRYLPRNATSGGTSTHALRRTDIR